MRTRCLVALLLLSTTPGWACGFGMDPGFVLLALGVLGSFAAVLGLAPIVFAGFYLRKRALGTPRFLLALCTAGFVAWVASALLLRISVALWPVVVPAAVLSSYLVCRLFVPNAEGVAKPEPGLSVGFTP